MTPLRWPEVRSLHLVLSSLGAVVVDAGGIGSIRAEDASGGFGLWPGHEDFLTVLGLGVLSWRADDGAWRHCALRRGVLSMRRGCEVEVASREVIPGDDLDHLERVVLQQLAERQQAEDAARHQSRELEVRALHALVRQLRPSGAHPGEFQGEFT